LTEINNDAQNAEDSFQKAEQKSQLPNIEMVGFHSTRFVKGGWGWEMGKPPPIDVGSE